MHLASLKLLPLAGGDTDTLGAIGVGIAKSYYHGAGLDEKNLLHYYLDDALYE